MRVASVVLFASVAVLVAAASKIESSVADEEGSSDQTPREARLNLDQADSRSDQSLQPPAPDTDGEASLATFLQPQFVVPDNGDPVGLRVKQCCQPGSSGSSGGSSDGDPTQVAEPPASARADSYGLLSGPELIDRDADVTQSPVSPLLPPAAQRRSSGPPLFPALTSAGPSGGRDTRGHLLSLIDGVYQQSLDTDANTTFITPLDRLGREPFELSVGRYSRFVEGQAKRRGQTHAEEEDLEDLLQRLKGRLELEEPEEGQDEEQSGGSVGDAANGSAEVRTANPVVDPGSGENITVGRAVDPGLTEPSILFDNQTGGGRADVRLSNGQAGQPHDTKDEEEQVEERPERNGEARTEDQHKHLGYEHKLNTAYEHKPEKAEGDKGVRRIIFGEVGKKETTKANDSTKYGKKDLDSKSLLFVNKNENLLQNPPHQAVLESVSSDHFSFSDNEKPCQDGCEPPPNKTLEPRNSDQESEQYFHDNEAENGKPRRSLNDVAELPDTLQPPSDSDSDSHFYTEPEARDAPASSLSGTDHTDDDLASTFLLDIADGDKQSKPDSSPFSTGDKKPRRLLEYKTHAEISLRGGHEAPDPEAEGYGPAKPSSLYKPSGDSESKDEASSEGDRADNEAERGVTPRSFDAEDIPLSSSKSSRKRPKPRMIEPWEPPKQQPRIKIHLPFVQKDTILQFHPRDRQKYGPPKGFNSKGSKRPTHEGHPPRQRGASGTTERPLPAGLRPPGRAPGDGHSAAESPLPSHLLPKEHRVTGQSHGQPQLQHDDRQRPGTGYQPPKQSSYEDEYQPLAQQKPEIGYHPAVQENPETGYNPPVHQSPDVNYQPPVAASPAAEYQPVQPGPDTYTDYQSPVPSHPQQDYGAPVYLAPPAQHDPQTYQRPTSGHRRPSLRPAWLDVPHEVLPLAEPPGASTELPYNPTTELSFDSLRLTTPAPAYVPPKPPYTPPTQEYNGASGGNGGASLSSYSQVEPSPAPHGSTRSPPVQNYVSPIPVRLSSTTPSSYASLESTPSHASPKHTPSYSPQKPNSSYAPSSPTISYDSPKPIPSYAPQKPNLSLAPPKPNPSYAPPKPTPSHAPQKPNPSYAPPLKPNPSYAPPKPTPSYAPQKSTPSYAPPKPTPSYSAPVHPAPEPALVRLPYTEMSHALSEYPAPQPSAVILPLAPIRNYAVPSVDKLAERPLARAPAGSHVQGFVEPPHDDLKHRLPPPEVHSPHPAQVLHAIRNYVAPPEHKLVQKPQALVDHTSYPVSDGQSVRNYVAPPELVQTPQVPVVHTSYPVSTGQPVRNYAATSEDRPAQKPQLVLALSSHQAPAGHITRNYQHPDQRTARDGADRRTVQQDTTDPHIVVEPLQRSDDNHSADGARQGRPVRPVESGQQQTPDDDHSLQQQQQDHSSAQQLLQDHSSRQQLPQDHSSPQQLPQDHSSRQQLPQDHSSPQKLPQDHSSRQQLPQDHSSRQQLPQDHSSHQQLPQNHSSRQKLPQDHSSPQQLPQATFTDSHPPRKPQEETSIVDVLEAAGSKLLLKLMELSGFRQLLEDTGPYTLFAPSEQALQDLVQRLGGLDTILDRMGKESLLQLLQYHVLRGYALLEDLDHDLLAKTLEGSRLRVNRYDTYDNSHGRANVTTVNGERLVRADLAADNGLVHFIEGVLAPPPADLMQTLQRDPRGRFTVLTEALRLAGLQSVLTDRTGGPLTLLAPTNVAFTQLPADQLRRLLRDRHRLRQLLLGHVISGTLYSAGLQPFQEEDTLAGTTVRVFSDTVSMKVENAMVLVPDVSAGNGVVHAIDAVLGLQEER